MAALGVFLLIILGTLTGAISGFVVGLAFGNIITYTLAQFGIHGVALWQLGATLGFVGPFFKSTQVNNAAK